MNRTEGMSFFHFPPPVHFFLRMDPYYLAYYRGIHSYENSLAIFAATSLRKFPMHFLDPYYLTWSPCNQPVMRRPALSNLIERMYLGDVHVARDDVNDPGSHDVGYKRFCLNVHMPA